MSSVTGSTQGGLPHYHQWLAALVLGGGHNVAGDGCGGYMGALWGLYGGMGIYWGYGWFVGTIWRAIL